MPLLARIAASNAEISAALWMGNMEMARTLISRKVGWMILTGAIVVKLKKPSKAALYG